MDKLEEEDLKALLSDEIAAARVYDDTELSEKRGDNLEYFQGIMRDVPAKTGRSSVVSRDVADVIGWMLPGIVRVFTASDRMGVFEPTQPNDEEMSDQATDYCNYVFSKENNGYRILWDATHDSLLHANGVVKAYWDDKEECEYSEHSGLNEMQLAQLLQEEGVEVVSQAQEETGQFEIVQDPQTGQPTEQPLMTYSVKIKRTISTGRIVVDTIEPENVLKNEDCIDLADARFVAHRDEKTKSDLIEMGFDRQLVDDLPADHLNDYAEESLARDDARARMGDVGHESTRKIELFECYVKADANGDGIAETIRAYYAGAAGTGELLHWEIWDDDHPFHDIGCNPIPHRYEGISIADQTVDIQKIKTVLQRQMLDNTYATNLPQREVEEGTVRNPDALVNPKFGGIIWRKRGALPIQPHAIPYTADKTLVTIEHFNQVIEKRTGVSRSTMALDPEALQNQTATANQNQKDAAYSKVELIARNMAEGWRSVFKAILQLSIKHQDRPKTIRLRDEWVEMDPRHWNARMDVSINVGLGTGSRERDMVLLQQVLQQQSMMAERLHAGGLAKQASEYIPLIRDTAVKIAESAGFKNADKFYPEFGEEDMKQAIELAEQPPENPVLQIEQMKAQAQIQIEQMKVQAQMQADQAKAEIEQQDKAMQVQVQRDKEQAQLDADMTLERERQQGQVLIHADKLKLDRDKLDADTENKALDRELKERDIELKYHAMKQKENKNVRQN